MPSPILRLGAASPGGLQLPAAVPSARTMYAPRGAWTDGARLVVSDTGNQRVLIWHSMPTTDGQPADVVLGQQDFTSEGPQASGAGPQRGLHLPTGVDVIDGDLVVADGWNHRILAFDGIPETSYARPHTVIGQPDLECVEPNAGGEPTMSTFYWPFGFAVVGDAFWVADTGNRRVLGWRGGRLPEPGRPADILLGQDSPGLREDNRGGDPTPVSFRWPHAITGDDDTLYIADAGDHRVLGWTPHPQGDDDAGLVLGQSGFTTAEEFKNRPQGAARMRFPYGAAASEGRLAIADTSNNRILLWDALPKEGAAIPADGVLGQPDFDANGENRWDAVADDSLCWPYGICLAGELLAIADSGNNRVMLWTLA